MQFRYCLLRCSVCERGAKEARPCPILSKLSLLQAVAAPGTMQRRRSATFSHCCKAETG